MIRNERLKNKNLEKNNDEKEVFGLFKIKKKGTFGMFQKIFLNQKNTLKHSFPNISFF